MSFFELSEVQTYLIYNGGRTDKTQNITWPTEKHFASWLGLSPGNKITGGKIPSSKTKPLANRAAAAFRMTAFGLLNSDSAQGDYYRRQRSRLGAPIAITATAHKFARTFYSLINNGSEYVDKGQDYYGRQCHDRIVKGLKKRDDHVRVILFGSIA